MGLVQSRAKTGEDSLEAYKREEGASCCALKCTSTFALATFRNTVAAACQGLSTTAFVCRTTAVSGQGSSISLHCRSPTIIGAKFQ